MATEIIENDDTASLNKEAITKLGKLLKELNITSAFYVDDYNCQVEGHIVTALIKTLIDSGEAVKVKEKLGNDIDIELPETSFILDDFNTKWSEFDEAKRIDIFKKVSEISDSSFSADDFDRTMQLKNIFPNQSLELISPDKWKSNFEVLQEKLAKKLDNKVLLIFDQDLTNASHQDFKSGKLRGDDLIEQVKNSPISKQAYCTLITHVIESVSDEFSMRKEIAKANKGILKEKDFFALSKKRNTDPHLLCDGIKKALLDPYFELIKTSSIKIIKAAQKKVIQKINTIDTYDFDQSILISSLEEGVWEADTLLRVTDIIYDDCLKDLMKTKKYASKINPFIKKAKKISDIKFKVPKDIYPYKDSDSIRKSEIYLKSELLNGLNLPLENGDVFEVYAGEGIGKYILLGQECDLVIRKAGSRESKFAVLCKIEEKSYEDIILESKNFTDQHGVQNHYLGNKFILEYFKDGNEELGLITFKKTILVDLNVLDLTVFNKNGEASTLGLNKVNKDLLNQPWEKRLGKIISHYDKIGKELNALQKNIGALGFQVKNEIIERTNQPLSIDTVLGERISFDGKNFIYKIKRITRLRSPYNKDLLDKYAKYLARTANAHDFAKVN